MLVGPDEAGPVLCRWDPDALLGLLRLPPEARADLADVATGLSTPPDEVLATLLDRLP